MRPIPTPNFGEVSMDPMVRYSYSKKAFENEKRSLRMSDEDEAKWLAAKKERNRLLREDRFRSVL